MLFSLLTFIISNLMLMFQILRQKCAGEMFLVFGKHLIFILESVCTIKIVQVHLVFNVCIGVFSNLYPSFMLVWILLVCMDMPCLPKMSVLPFSDSLFLSFCWSNSTLLKVKSGEDF